MQTLEYSIERTQTLNTADGAKIASFMTDNGQNIDAKTVESFGSEWTKFATFSDPDLKNAGENYFDIVTPAMLNNKSLVLDLGCGIGRWSKYIAARSGFIEAVDPSSAVFAAHHFIGNLPNVRITQASADRIPFADESFDFMMSLGVLHHIPDTQLALNTAVRKVKSGGYVLLYLYYALENRSFLFKSLFHLSSLLRNVVSHLPEWLKKPVCDLLAVMIYLPLVTLVRLVRSIAPRSNLYTRLPLSYYADKTFGMIRNDALDRFGTPLERRFRRTQIQTMMQNVGLTDIVFSELMPFWHVVGRKA